MESDVAQDGAPTEIPIFHGAQSAQILERLLTDYKRRSLNSRFELHMGGSYLRHQGRWLTLLWMDPNCLERDDDFDDHAYRPSWIPLATW